MTLDKDIDDRLADVPPFGKQKPVCICSDKKANKLKQIWKGIIISDEFRSIR